MVARWVASYLGGWGGRGGGWVGNWFRGTGGWMAVGPLPIVIVRSVKH